MKLYLIFFSLIATLINTGCKTTEEIRKEQMINSLNVQMIQNQRLSADSTVRLQQLEENVQMLQGTIEKSNNQNKEIYSKDLTSLKNEVNLLKEIQNTQTEKISKLENELVNQKNYLENLLKSIKEISENAASKIKNNNSRNNKNNDYDHAIDLYLSKNYRDARDALLPLVEIKMSGEKKARVFHNLGMCEYQLQNYKDALVHFSKLLTKFPNYKYNSNAYLHLGRSFLQLGQKDNAVQAFNEVIKKYPENSNAKLAKEELSKISN